MEKEFGFTIEDLVYGADIDTKASILLDSSNLLSFD